MASHKLPHTRRRRSSENGKKSFLAVYECDLYLEARVAARGEQFSILCFFSGICKKTKKEKDIFFLLIVNMIYSSSLYVVMKMNVMAEI